MIEGRAIVYFSSGRFIVYVVLCVLVAVPATLFTMSHPVGLKVVIASLIVGASYGILSCVISARKLYFLAAASPHSALLAASLGLLLYVLTGYNPRGYSIAIGIPMLLFAGVLIREIRNTELATGVFVSLTSSLSALIMFYITSKFRASEAAVAEIIVGNLGSADWGLIAEGAAILAVIVAVTLTSYYGLIYSGLSTDEHPKVKALKYDLLLFTSLALATVGLIKMTGFILEHVLILLPGAIATIKARSAIEALLISLTSSVVAAVLGAITYLASGLSPSGISGIVLLAVFTALYVLR